MNAAPRDLPPKRQHVPAELCLLMLTQSPQRDATWCQLRALLNGEHPQCTDEEWDDLALAARHAEVAALVVDRSEALAPRLLRVVRRQMLVDMHLQWAEERVAEVLRRTGVHEVALFKGAAAARSVYSESWHRLRRDVDLLLPSDSFAAVIDALERDGWHSDAAADAVAVGPAKAGTWPVYLETSLGRVYCDLHRRVFACDRFSVDEPGVLKRAVRHARGLPMAALEDNLLLTALHLAGGGFQEPLKAWVDLKRMLSHPSLDLNTVIERSRQWSACAALWGCLVVIQRWFPDSVPRSLWSHVLPGFPARVALAFLLAGDGEHPQRRQVGRHAARGATGMWICDGLGPRLKWARRLASRRLHDVAV